MRTGLTRELWTVQVGIFLNMLGYGAVLPYEVIYLHNGRGFSLGVAGLVVGALSGVAVAVVAFAGPLIDRFGARVVMAGAGVALAAGYAGLAFAISPWEAFAAAALAGLGNGAMNPSQSTLLATLAGREVRHRVTAVSRVSTNAGLGLGAAGGGFIASSGLGGLVLLFLANAITYLLYVGVVLALVRESPRPDPLPGGYGQVFRDRAFVRLALTNVAMIAAGWGVINWLLPAYARNTLGIDTRLIGLMLLANTATVVVAQVPIARLAEGRRRVRMIAIAGAIFCGALGLTAVAGVNGRIAYPLLVLAVVAVGAGECFYTTVLSPLVADLAPPAIRGRYMAATGLSWWAGMAIAPALGAQTLSAAPQLTFLIAGAVAAAAGASALRLEARLPDAARLTPRPGLLAQKSPH